MRNCVIYGRINFEMFFDNRSEIGTNPTVKDIKTMFKSLYDFGNCQMNSFMFVRAPGDRIEYPITGRSPYVHLDLEEVEQWINNW